jgi:hypothetical protein
MENLNGNKMVLQLGLKLIVVVERYFRHSESEELGVWELVFDKPRWENMTMMMMTVSLSV